MTELLLNIESVSKYYKSGRRQFAALEAFSLNLAASTPQIIAIAGESGSGKSTLANLVLGFDECSAGRIEFEGQNIVEKNQRQLKQYRRDVQAVFQDPFGVFNPFYRVTHVFDLVFNNFPDDFPKPQRQELLEKALNVVGLSGPDILRKFPHQLSGGQRQRIMMARACLMKPKLIVADEPVSMVDASLRASILDVMMRLRDEEGISFLYITHDLATAYQVSDYLFLLYQGRIMEEGPATQVIGQPSHPYAKLLVESIPGIEYSSSWINSPIEQLAQDERYANATGCRFAQRCPLARESCQSNIPELKSYMSSEKHVACHFHDEL